ncbi:MAG: hypothetical protein JKX94_10170, partial [Sneathiella sp.]|nr:hypothetical protein [Sneathiella sp.]
IDIPYPISKLLAKLSVRTGVSVGDFANGTVKTALIPIGRSLQRYAADPDFFLHPRAIFAFTKSSKATTFPSVHMADRLYIAYQERAEALEIISYNEQAGRYEFQVVSNYAAGKTPILEYAERSVCIACHQNHGPIFATAPWDETGANRSVASRMAQGGATRYGIPVKSSLDTADLLDQSTDRANRIFLYQKIWSEGCAKSADGVDVIRCRAALLASSLKFALSGYNRSAVAKDLADQAFRNNLIYAFQVKWPDGLAESNPDIPNRNINSFLKNKDAKLADLLELDGAHNPQTDRQTKKIWTAQRENDPVFNQIRLGFSRFFAPGDFQYLDQLLRQQREFAEETEFSGQCVSQLVGETDEFQELRSQCVLVDKKNTPFELSLYVKISRGKIIGGEITRAQLGDQISLYKLQLDLKSAHRMKPGRNRFSFSLQQKGTGLGVRLPNGDALDDLMIEIANWNTKTPQQWLALKVVQYAEGSILDKAMRDLIDLSENDIGKLAKKSLQSPVFQRSLILEELVAQLGGAKPENCCRRTAGMPVPVVQGN